MCCKYRRLTWTFRCGNEYKAQLRLMELSLVLQVSGDNPKHWTMWNFDLMMAVEKKLGESKNYAVILGYPQCLWPQWL